MKAITTVAAFGVLRLCSTANAALLELQFYDGNQTAAFYLHGQAENGFFNTIKLEATPQPSTTFVSLNSGLSAGFPRAPGEPFTYRNRMLDLDPLDGGMGWAVVGTSTTANLLGFTGGPLGQTISTAGQPGGRLFLGNLRFSRTFALPVVKVQLSDAGGNVVRDLVWVWPEPSSGCLAGLVILGLVPLQRHRRNSSTANRTDF